MVEVQPQPFISKQYPLWQRLNLCHSALTFIIQKTKNSLGKKLRLFELKNFG